MITSHDQLKILNAITKVYYIGTLKDVMSSLKKIKYDVIYLDFTISKAYFGYRRADIYLLGMKFNALLKESDCEEMKFKVVGISAYTFAKSIIDKAISTQI